MEIDACIRGRRSVRAFKSDHVAKELIDEVLEAGVWAPSGMNRQPWRFVVIEDRKLIGYISDETKLMIREMMPTMGKQFETKEDIICYNAPVLIFICAEVDDMWKEVSLLDSVLAAQNMFLKAHELGLGSCYMGFITYLNKKPEVLRKAGVPEGCELMVPLILGHPKTKTAPGNRNAPKVLKWIK
jgi:nitroreductase